MKIRFINGDHAGRVVEFALLEISIGRDDCNILRLSTGGVSRYHARLTYSEERGWVIVDQNSTNGVKVNGIRIAGEQVVFDGDELTIGEQKMELSGLSAAPSKVVFNPVMSLSTPVLDRDAATAAPGTSVTRTIELKEEKKPAAQENKVPASGDVSRLLDELHAQENGLFGSNAKTEPQKTANGQKTPPAAPGRKKNRRLLLYSLLLFFLLVIFFTAGRSQQPRGKAGAGAAVPKTSGMSLYYEKTEFSADNAFRFSLLLEGNKATFVLDDIKSRRHPEPIVLEDVGGLGALYQKIASSKIWKMKKPAPPMANEPLRRRLVLADPPRLLDLTIGGSYAPLPFEELERAIETFAENHGLQTVVLSEDALLRQAESSFASAEDLFENSENNPEALRDAIARYRVTVNYLEPVRPHPAIWNKARHRLQEAQNLRKQRIRQLNFEINRLKQLKDVKGLRNVFRQIMELSEEDSREWNYAKQQMLIVERIIRQESKR